MQTGLHHGAEDSLYPRSVHLALALSGQCLWYALVGAEQAIHF
jgi:hypothetical protein